MNPKGIKSFVYIKNQGNRAGFGLWIGALTTVESSVGPECKDLCADLKTIMQIVC